MSVGTFICAKKKYYSVSVAPAEGAVHLYNL